MLAFYNDFLTFLKDNGDPRVGEWFLVYDDPIHVWILTALYVIFSSWLGPRIMKNRPAFDLRVFMIVYNAFQVLLSLYLVIELLYSIYLNDYNLICQPFSVKTAYLKPTELRVAKVNIQQSFVSYGFVWRS